MTNEIIRAPTDEERKDFTPLVDPKKRSKTAQEKFQEDVANHAHEAAKKGLPFAERAVKDEFNDYYKTESTKVVRKFGYVKADEIKPLKIDWDRYSDLKNFEVVDQGEKEDEHLTRRNPGLQVMIKWTQYRFKGYENIYQINESASSAINRARKKNKE